jgi:hypothetical protein
MLFYGVYRFLLYKETYFQSIRLFLLSGIIAAFILPLIIIPIYIDTEPIQFTQTTNSITNFSPTNILNSSVNWTTVLFYSYYIITAMFLIRFIFQLLSIASIIFKNKRVKIDNFYYIETDEETSPFSFFNFIIYNSGQFTQSELEQILAHEKTHAIQKHSFDTLLSNLLIITQWYNPICWLYKKNIEQNLEFIADELAQKESNSNQSYQQLLLKTSIPNYQMALANNFYNSLLKKRIIMLHKKRSNRKSQWKIALIVPFLLAFVFTFNTKLIAQQKNGNKKIVKVKVEVFAMSIEKESAKDYLKEVTKLFAEKGLKVAFSDLKRNGNGEITAIKIDAKANSGKASAAYAANDDDGINSIQISFDNENNNLSIGSSDRHNIHGYSFSDKGHRKIVKHKGKGNNFVYFSDNDDEQASTKVWVNKSGDTKDSFVFISDDDDENTITTYIVNGKKMSKEAFKKFDKDKIKTIEIKKEVKK